MSGRRIWELISVLTTIPSSVASFSIAMFLLGSLNIYITIGVVVFSIPQFWVSKKFTKLEYDLESKISPRDRLWSWCKYYLTKNRNFIELKILSISSFLSNKLRSIQNEIILARSELQKKESKYRILAELPLIIYEGVISLWLVFQVVSREITVGSFQFYLRTIKRAQNEVVNFMHSINTVYENYIYVKDFFWFMNLKSEDVTANGKIDVPKDIHIELREVWFKYKKGQKWVLKNINLNIKAGEKIAFVGVNGAGKSTLIKIISGFYKPQKGSVLINN
ncbi:MAG: ABC transporter ATP-binding protein/permease, partial [Patescibacteria group bacterium]|nr:ABC transporter ATP-binding protein/permease [Patescibacteria group bacterium]